jgi:DNA-binding NarL/FixJ family response regulator
MDETNMQVLVVDDQQLIRDGIASMLDFQPGIKVIGTAQNGKEAVEKAEALEPDVILMDIQMPEMDGIEATEQIKEKMPNCKVVMLTTFDEEAYIIRSLRAGAFGYLMKDIPVKELASAIQLAHAGITQLAPDIAGKLVGRLSEDMNTKDVSAAEYGLTERELEVLGLIATGATNQEIGASLHISRGTVKNHVSNILNRLGMEDRTQAAIYALKNKLI